MRCRWLLRTGGTAAMWRAVLIWCVCAVVGASGGRALGMQERAADGEVGGAGVAEAAGRGGVDGFRLTAEAVRERLAVLGEDDPAAERYRRALAALERSAAARTGAAGFRERAANAAERLAAVRADLEQPAAEALVKAEAGAELATLERGEAEAEASLNAARQRVSELEAEASRREDRRKTIPALLAASRQRAETMREEVGTVDAMRGVDVTDAGAVLARAQLEEVEAEVAALEAELAAYEAERDLLPARRDRAARRVVEAERRVEAWREVVAEARRRDAERAAAEARRLQREAARRDPALQAYAARNTELAADLDEDALVPGGLDAARRSLAETRERFESLRARYRSVAARLEASSLNRATGIVLRRQFESLPDTAALRREVSATRRELETAEFALIERREARETVRNVGAEVDRLLAEAGAESEAEREVLEPVVRELVMARRELLGSLVNDATRYAEALYELDRLKRELLGATVAYRSFISERILWVRSLPPDRWPTLTDARLFSGWLTDAGGWRGAFIGASRWLVAQPAAALFGAFALVSVWACARMDRRRLKEIAQRVNRYRTDSLALTLRALVCTAVMSLPIGLTVAAVGLVLQYGADGSSHGEALGAGLTAAGVVWIVLMFVRQVSRQRGLAEVHFRWPVGSVKALRLRSHRAAMVVPLAVGVAVLAHASGVTGATATIGRGAFTVAALGVAYFLYRVLHPKGAVLAAYLARDEVGWLNRLKLLWFWGLVGAPLALVVAAWLGYSYTAQELALNLGLTIVFLFVVTLGHALLLRWLYLARRRVAVEDARRRRQQAATEQRAVDDDAGPTEGPSAVEEDKVNLPAISGQAKQLIAAATAVVAVIGIFYVWADALPALRILDRVELYPSVRIVEADEVVGVPALERSPVVTGGSGGAEAAERAQLSAEGEGDGGSAFSVPGLGLGMTPSLGETGGAADTAGDGGEEERFAITLGHVTLALLVLFVTAIGFRNLPGLVEMLVLQRLPLDAGSRYALATVLRYGIAIVGVALAFGAVNISWSNVQWLAAALTFGLAFGLQEIFANFVSGLIILAERPIRIGDTVTVQGISGTVSRIRMRATTITDWDRKELVIPNKSFITGDVINWTLSDPTLRLTVPVGVGYSADVRKAERLLVRVAHEHPNVLDDPEPYVNFTRFGDSTLDLELRVFLPSIDHLLSVRHDLHMRITEVFREEGIEIAFPQRDLHVRSIGDLAGLVQKREHLPVSGGVG